MAIKIYQSQIRPTAEVKERASTGRMQMSLSEAQAPGKALQGMLEAGENLYVAYEKQKSENEVIEAAKEIDRNQISHLDESYIKKGLGTQVNEFSESVKPDEALANYKTAWQNELDKTLPTLKGKFSKRFFNSYMNKRFIRESGSIRDNTFVNFRNESKVLKIDEIDHLSKILANNPKDSRTYKLAATELDSFFKSQSNYNLFGDQFKKLQFDTLSNIDELTISADLAQDAITTLNKFNAGEYKNLNAESYTRLKAKITSHAQYEMKQAISEDSIRAALGKEALIDTSTYLKAFVGHKDFDNIKIAVDANNYVRSAIQQVNSSKQSDLADIELYSIEGSGAEIAAKQKANSIITAARNNRIKLIQNGDAAGWLNTIDDEVNSLNNKIANTTNVDDKKILLNERTILLNQKYEELNINNKNRFVLSQNEAASYVSQVKNITNPEEKDAFLNGIIDLHGKENAPNVIKHLALEKLPIPYQISLSTNSQDLKADILASTTTKNLEKTVKDEGYKTKDIREKISEGLEKYKAVIENQAPGSMDVVVYTNAIVDTVYKAALNRIVKTEDEGGSIDSAVNDFMKDYFIPNKNYYIPVDVNGQATNQQAIVNKTESIQLAVEEGTLLDEFMVDGYKHFAELAEEDISEADAKEVVKKSIQQHSRWALSPDGDGLVLNVELANGGFVPIVNTSGQAIEFKFLNPEFIFPGTNAILPIGEEEMINFGEGGA